MEYTVPSSAELATVATRSADLCAAVESVLAGKSEIVRTTVAVLLAQGHLLLEDVPGVGKTTLATALARAVGCTTGRIQFTPDLLPSDLTGVSIFRAEVGEFEFRPGPIFANIVIGDEVNRASPKTQSALLESMQERQVTVDGNTHALPEPFFVVATQNPIEMEGTYPLPEAQRDRFTARLTVGYPPMASELEMLDRHEQGATASQMRPVMDPATVRELIAIARRVHASQALKQYVVNLVTATRTDPALRLGASPRAAIQLLRVAKALAAMAGRNHVLPDDIQALAIPVLAHRVLPHHAHRLAVSEVEDLISQIVQRVAVPAPEAPRQPALRP